MVRQNRRSTEARGYGKAHQELRRRWKLHMAVYGDNCARCGGWMPPGSAFHLDHSDDRKGYIGVSHPTCNTVASVKNRRKKDYDGPPPVSSY